MFPIYPVLKSLRNDFDRSVDLDDYYIISVQHLLQSTGSLFEELIKIGFKPKNIILTGKIYSTHEATKNNLKSLGINIIDSSIPKNLGFYADYLEKDTQRMWSMLVSKTSNKSKIIVLDEGGYTLRNIPNILFEKSFICGIEQTTSGIRMDEALNKIPVILLAASAAKKKIEPRIVSEAVIIHLGKRIKSLKPRTIGIIGLGNIGNAIIANLEQNYDLVVYDINPHKYLTLPNHIKTTTSIDELFLLSDIIIGATGTNVSNIEWLKIANSNKTLISVSSSDVEFNVLLRNGMPFMINKMKDPRQDILYRTENKYTIRLVRGGMVANFTGSANSSPGPIIQMTRGLILGAIIQIIINEAKIKGNIGGIMLDPSLQSKVVSLWFKNQPQRRIDYTSEILSGFLDLDWIAKNSEGIQL